MNVRQGVDVIRQPDKGQKKRSDGDAGTLILYV